MIAPRLVLALACAAPLAACASRGDYPSLALRPAERATGSFTPDTAPEPPPAPVAPDRDLTRQLSALRDTARGAHAQFRRATPAAERAAAGAGTTGTDSWAAAQVALADLDALRSQTAIPLGDLDILLAESMLESGAAESVGTVRAEVEALVAEEDAVLARLRGRVGR